MELKEFPHLVIDYFIDTRDFIFDVSKLKSYYNLSTYDIRDIYNIEILKETFIHLYETLTFKYKGSEHMFIKAELSEFIINLLYLITRNIKYKNLNNNDPNHTQAKISSFRFLMFNLLEDYIDNIKNLIDDKENVKLYAASLLSNLTHVLLITYLKRNGVLSKDLCRMCLKI